MTLKEELEILRGEAIEVFTGDPMDIPCIETSDPEKLCKHPVVSVHMITYNHEPYIRQAIEGVMMQKTDFEYELVIGEDASTDKTREICFEYQKRYPEKIRVLWWHENLYRNPHPAGGNGRRNAVRCRGEFIAYCEGDDYWTDPLKLQKQVDLMRHQPTAGMCFCGARVTMIDTDEQYTWDDSAFKHGVMPGLDFFRTHCFGRPDRAWPGGETFLNTATVMCRQSVLREARLRFEIMRWKLRLGDVTTWLGLSACSDVIYLPDVVSVYRRNSGSVCNKDPYNLNVDGLIVRLYYAVVVLGLPLETACKYWRDIFAINFANRAKLLPSAQQHSLAVRILRERLLRLFYFGLKTIFLWMLLFLGLGSRLSMALPIRIILKTHKNQGFPA